MSTTSIPSSRGDPDRRRDGGQVPAHRLVRDEQPAPEERGLPTQPLEPRQPVQLLGGLAAPGPDVAGAVHQRLARRDELVVPVDPPRIVRGEHVGLDPERRQVGRELERPLDAAPAGRREVDGDDEQLHRRPMVLTKKLVDALPAVAPAAARSEPVEDEARVDVRGCQVQHERVALPVDDDPAGAVPARDPESPVRKNAACPGSARTAGSTSCRRRAPAARRRRRAGRTAAIR